MKKYLFLLFMFIFYLGLIVNKKTGTKSVMVYDDFNKNVIKIEVLFSKGQNINQIIKTFKSYNDDYQILKVETFKKSYDCHEKINDCVKNIYDQENSNFNKIYISSGFSVKSVDVIANKNSISKFLQKNNLVYKELQ